MPPIDLKLLSVAPPAAVPKVEVSEIVASPFYAPRAYQTAAPPDAYTSRWEPVRMSPDLDRILKLPRREPLDLTSPRAEALADMMTARFGRGERACACAELNTQVRIGKKPCFKRLKPVQAWALYEIGIVGGLLANIVVGGGKSGIDILAPLALLPHGVRSSLLLVPPGLVEQLKNDYALIAEHFRVPEIWFHDGTNDRVERPDEQAVLHVLPYSRLSLSKSSSWIRNLAPDAIISDECDRLKAPDGAGTSRVLRQFYEHGNTRFCGWTGSLTDQSISEYFHLAALALQYKSPLPLDKAIVDEWGRAIDASDSPAPPGELLRLCAPGEGVHEGFRRRLAETMGIVISTASSVDVEIRIDERVPPAMPRIIEEALHKLRTTWVRPDMIAGSEYDEELIDAMAVQACAQQLACGLFYRWEFPRGEPVALIKEWLAARKDWNRELRKKLLDRREHLDSPQLCEHAAQRAWGDRPNVDDLPEWKAYSWPRWCAVKALVKPKSVGVRFPASEGGDFLAQDAADWARTNRGIVWYGLAEFGRWVSEISGLPLHGGGPGAGQRLVGGKHGKHVYAGEDGSRSVICSLKSHGRGRDGLQHLYANQLIANPPASAALWEQCLDAETEVLSDRGWRGINESWEGVRAAAYDTEDGSVHWSQATPVYRALGAELMYGISNPHLDIRVTAGHRMLVQRSRHVTRSTHVYDPREFVAAEDMPRVGRVPVAGLEVGAGVPLTDHELMFLGLFMTNGNLDPSNNTIGLFQSEKHLDIIALIERTMVGCGFKARRSVNTKPTNFGPRSPLHKWVISFGVSKKTEKHLRGWGALVKYVDKNFPHTLEAMTGTQLRVFLRGMWAGDGNKTAGTYEYDLYNSQTTTICTKRHAVADRLQSLCVRRGLRCTVAKSRMSTLHISEDLTWTVKRSAAGSRPIWGVLPSDPYERVWCVAVDTGAIVTRRNGKVAIVGNCLGRLHRQGQNADLVTALFYRHTDEIRAVVDEALRRAAYVEGTLGQVQKLRMGFKF